MALKYWEIIADNLHDAGWSLGWVSALDLEGRTLWIVDAHGYGKRFIVRSDEKLTAFLELESVIRAAPMLVVSGHACQTDPTFLLDEQVRFSQDSASLHGSESGGGHRPARFFVFSGPAIKEPTERGKEG